MVATTLYTASVMNLIYIACFIFLVCVALYTAISFRNDMKMHKESMEKAKKSLKAASK